MLDDRIRQRIEALNRGAIAPTPGASTRGQSSPQVARASPVASAAALPALLERGEPVANLRGEHLRIRVPLDELWPGSATLAEKRIAAVRQRRESLHSKAAGVESMTESGLKAGPAARATTDRQDLADAFPDRLLLLDLETCGLAGAALFLIGVLRQVADQLTVELLLARDYSEEGAVLESLWAMVNDDTVLATFNGKSFDWPMVQDRTARHLLFRDARPPLPKHIDILHHARRRWKTELPNCKLQTLEAHVCRRRREGDLPGSLIPAAYEEFVRTGFDREMNAILRHNAIDLVTLFDLALRLAE